MIIIEDRSVFSRKFMQTMEVEVKGVNDACKIM